MKKLLFIMLIACFSCSNSIKQDQLLGEWKCLDSELHSFITFSENNALSVTKMNSDGKSIPVDAVILKCKYDFDEKSQSMQVFLSKMVMGNEFHVRSFYDGQNFNLSMNKDTLVIENGIMKGKYVRN